MNVKYIFLINNKSGSRKGKEMKELLSNNEINTFDIYELSKTEKLQDELNKLINKETIICICGGDGSISWACSIINKCTTLNPRICVVPMGTGNDLSRTLGWGIKNLSYDKTIQLLEKIKICIRLGRFSEIDWWNIEYLDCNIEHIQHLPTKMLCYMSVGYDAKITQHYQADRNKNPEKFNSQIYNKLMYIKHGIKEFFKQSKKISNKIKLFCDEEEISLPNNCRSLKLLNINSAAAGIFFWGNKSEKQFEEPVLNDNKIEIVSSFGVYNLLCMNTGLLSTKRIKQSSETIICIENGMYIQIDGEGFKMPKCKIRVSRFKQIPIVVGYKKTLGVFHMDNSYKTVQYAIKEYKKDYWKVKDKNI